MLGNAGLATEPPAKSNSLADFLGGIEFGGHLHTLASYNQTETVAAGQETVADIHVNSLELGLAASPYPFLDANVVWLLEEAPGGGSAGQSFVVDQAFVTLSGTPAMLKKLDQRRGMPTFSPWYLQAGKFYAPFATELNYHTFDGIAEPPTLALGETLESGARVGYHPDGFHAFAGIYGGAGQDGGPNGATIDARDDDLDDYYVGASVAGAPGELAVRWMSNLNNSITLQDELGTTTGSAVTARAEDANPGLTVYGRTGKGAVTVQASYVAVLDDYQYGTLAGRKPRAAAAELTYRVNHTWEATAVYHRTADWPDHAELGAGAVVGARLFTGLSVAGQYLQRRHNTRLSSNEREHIVALLLDVEFGARFGPLVRNRASAVE